MTEAAPPSMVHQQRPSKVEEERNTAEALTLSRTRGETSLDRPVGGSDGGLCGPRLCLVREFMPIPAARRWLNSRTGRATTHSGSPPRGEYEADLSLMHNSRRCRPKRSPKYKRKGVVLLLIHDLEVDSSLVAFTTASRRHWASGWADND